MADIADKANDAADTFLDAALRKRKHGATVAPSGAGLCLSCEAPVTGGRRWCDAYCRDDWEAEQRG